MQPIEKDVADDSSVTSTPSKDDEGAKGASQKGKAERKEGRKEGEKTFEPRSQFILSPPCLSGIGGAVRVATTVRTTTFE